MPRGKTPRPWLLFCWLDYCEGKSASDWLVIGHHFFAIYFWFISNFLGLFEIPLCEIILLLNYEYFGIRI